MLFRSVFSKNLSDEKVRSKAIESAVQSASQIYQTKSNEEAREPILKLRDVFDKQSLDRLPLLCAAEAQLSHDSYWLDEIITNLLKRQSIDEPNVAYLMRKAQMEPGRLDLWHRIFKEYRRLGSHENYQQAREQCALTFIPFFPNAEESFWENRHESEEAYSMLIQCLDDAVTDAIDSNRDDALAVELFQGALEHLPERRDVRTQMALLTVKEEIHGVSNIRLVLEALVEDPQNKELKFWAGKALLHTPGHVAQGLQMLRQLHEDYPNDKDIMNALVSALKEEASILDSDIPLFKAYCSQKSDDIRALELLGNAYADQEISSEEALAIYRKVIATSAKRNKMIKLLGHASASRSDWSEVIDLFEQFESADEITDDIVLPLATAYSNVSRNDPKALNIYQKALKLGVRSPDIHNAYCQHLYQTQPKAPESIKQFIQSAELSPECAWAHLGLMSYYLDTKDLGRALDSAIVLLSMNPRDKEALRLGSIALSKDFSRKQLAKMARLPQEAKHLLFEQAHKQAPDAGPIALGLVRCRLSEGSSDDQTLKLLADVCRLNPDMSDLRLARADILWSRGQIANAASLYREMIERWNSRYGHQLPKGITKETRRRILVRLAEGLLTPPGPTEDDIDILLEAVSEPDTKPEIILKCARALIDLEVNHPRRLALLQRAQGFAPGDLKLERAVAEAFAAQGNPKPAIGLAIRLITTDRVDDETVNLLRSVIGLADAERFSHSVIDELRGAVDPDRHPPNLLLAMNEMITGAGLLNKKDLPVLQRLAEAFPKNKRVQQRLAKVLTLSDRYEEAADTYQELMQDRNLDDDLILEMASTNARLGRTDYQYYDIAKKALRIEPENPEIILHTAAIELTKGLVSQSVKRLDWILEHDPDSHSRILNLLQSSQSVTSNNPHFALIYARIHIAAKRPEKAMLALAHLQSEYQHHFPELLQCYSEIIDIDPNSPRPYVERGILFRVAGQIEEAREDLKKAHELAPENIDIISEYADLLKQLVQSSQKLDWELAIKTAELYIKLNDIAEARVLTEIVIRQQPENEIALITMGRLQTISGNLQDAWTTLRKVKHTPEALGALQNLARAFAEEDEQILAAEVLNDAIQVAGPQRGLLEQLRSLYQEQAKTMENDSQRQQIFDELSETAQKRFELQEQIGSGAMGLVYKAYDNELDEIVVLKILPEHFSTDDEAIARFRNEAKAARKLAHPNICRIHDIGEEGGRKHICMEYVGGGDLKTFLKEQGGKLPQEEAVQIIRETARALAHAHSEGVLHRDIKTANIMLTSSGRVKLSDFGIAAIAEYAQHDPSGSTSSVIGTPLYMSPEQFDNDTLTPASDLYSLGVMFYELVNGRPPFTRGSIPYHHRFTKPVQIEEISDKLWSIIAKMLEKDPKGRFTSAESLLTALDEFEGRVPKRSYARIED